MTYEPMTHSMLVDLFTDLLTRVDSGDSWEGHVSWILPDPDDDVPEGTVAMVEARYRVGNADGSQGGMRVFGDLA